MTASFFQYNSIYIGNPQTGVSPNALDILAYNNTAVYDPSGTNLMLTKTTLTVRGLVSGDPSVIRNALMVPRAALNFEFGSGPYTQAKLLTGDDSFGPLPQECDIVMLGGSGPLCLVTFSISFEVYTGCTTSSAVLQFNYARTFSMDEFFLSTITTSGSFTTKPTTNPDSLRGLAWFPIPGGFRRKSPQFMISPDGLTLHFSIVDEEMPGANLPHPIVRGSAHFATSMDNYKWYNSFHATGRTHKLATKLDVFVQLLAQAKSRMDFKTEFIVAGLIGEDLYNQECSLSLTTLVTAYTSGPNGIYPSTTKLFTGVPTSATQEALGPYGSALVAAATTLWYNPCTGTTAASAVASSPGVNVSGPIVTVGTVSSASPGGSGGATGQNPNNPYLAYKDEYSWEVETGIVVVPAAMLGGGQSIFQAHDPYIVIKHSGHAAMAKQQPIFPTARLESGSYMRKRDQVILSPEYAPDNTTIEYGIMWDYELVVPMTGTAPSANGGNFEDAAYGTIAAPANPMIQTKPTPYAQPPNSNVAPGGAATK